MKSVRTQRRVRGASRRTLVSLSIVKCTTGLRGQHARRSVALVCANGLKRSNSTHCTVARTVHPQSTCQRQRAATRTVAQRHHAVKFTPGTCGARVPRLAAGGREHEPDELVLGTHHGVGRKSVHQTLSRCAALSATVRLCHVSLSRGRHGPPAVNHVVAACEVRNDRSRNLRCMPAAATTRLPSKKLATLTSAHQIANRAIGVGGRCARRLVKVAALISVGAQGSAPVSWACCQRALPKVHLARRLHHPRSWSVRSHVESIALSVPGASGARALLHVVRVLKPAHGALCKQL